MATRRQNISLRCPKCLIHHNLCFCDLIPKLETISKVSLVVHIKEKVLSSNTAHLAHQCLVNSEFYYRGQKDQNFSNIFSLDERYTPLYLYPTEDAQELNSNLIKEIKKPIQLIVPDGSWRQAKKFHKREEIFRQIQHVKLPVIAPSIYQLRKQKYKNTVCTLEALAYALGIIEGDLIEKELLKILKIKNKKVLESRSLNFI